MRTVAAVVDQGALTFDLAVPCEVFGYDRRDLADPWYEFMVVAAGAPRVPTQTGFVLEAPHGLSALARADTVVIPVNVRRGREKLVDRGPILIDGRTGRILFAVGPHPIRELLDGSFNIRLALPGFCNILR